MTRTIEAKVRFGCSTRMLLAFIALVLTACSSTPTARDSAQPQLQPSATRPESPQATPASVVEPTPQTQPSKQHTLPPVTPTVPPRQVMALPPPTESNIVVTLVGNLIPVQQVIRQYIPASFNEHSVPPHERQGCAGTSGYFRGRICRLRPKERSGWRHDTMETLKPRGPSEGVTSVVLRGSTTLAGHGFTSISRLPQGRRSCRLELIGSSASPVSMWGRVWGRARIRSARSSELM